MLRISAVQQCHSCDRGKPCGSGGCDALVALVKLWCPPGTLFPALGGPVLHDMLGACVHATCARCATLLCNGLRYRHSRCAGLSKGVIKPLHGGVDMMCS
eukprot:jgi/Ulvmu1/1993/UM012_0155.1